MQHRFTKEQREYIKNNAQGLGNEELTALVNEHFGISLGCNQIRAFKKNNYITSGLSGRFAPGRSSWNAGNHFNAGGRCAETQFKKGNKPHNYRPVGSERINVDGYCEVKVSDPKKWRCKHVIVWEKTYGPVPAGHAVIFADRDKNNLHIDNLLLVTRAQLVTMNKFSLIYSDPEATQSGAIIAKVLSAAANLQKRAM